MKGEFATEGLTWTPSAVHDLRIRHGVSHLPEAHDWELDSILAETDPSAEEPRVRVVRRRPGELVYDLRIHADGRTPRVSYTRHVTIKGQYAMTAARAAQPPYRGPEQWRAMRRCPDGERLAEVVYAAVTSPSQRFVVEVRFPTTYRPVHPQAKVLPDGIYPVESLADCRPRVHDREFSFREDIETGALTLAVDRPLVGLSYAISWLLP